MTLRNRLDGNVRNLFEHVNTLLDSEDALIVLFDGRRHGELYQRVRSLAKPTRAARCRDRTFGSQCRRWTVNQQEGEEES